LGIYITMVLLNASSRARHTGMSNNQCQGGGSKKPGLIPTKNQPAAVALAHRPHLRSIKQLNMMPDSRKNVTNGFGVGRRSTSVRYSAWNTNGTSANVCMLNNQGN
jgi:hypothetical protein